MNDDGYDDIVIGAEWYTASKVKEGAAFVYLGGPSGIASGDPASADTQLYGDQVDAQLGAHVAAVGDVNSDGYADLALGVPFYDAPLVDEGAAFLYLGGPSGIPSGGPGVASAILEGNQAGARFGESAISAGDPNGDGYGDLLVGASRYDAGSNDEGVALLFLGSASGIPSGGVNDAYLLLEENQQGSYFGSTTAAAGDVNGDGYDDALIGTAYWHDPESGEGAFFVYFGGPPADCFNGLDDDGDGLFDFPADPGCAAAASANESPQCNDGADNDGDTLVDLADPECVSASRDDESVPPPACSDGLDNDGDGKIDHDGGQSIYGVCTGGVCPPGVSDPNQDGIADPDTYCVGNPTRTTEKQPSCGIGAELVLVMPLLGFAARRRRGSRQAPEFA